MPDGLAIETSKPQKALGGLEAFRLGPLQNGFKFFGIHLETSARNNVAEEGHLWVLKTRPF